MNDLGWTHIALPVANIEQSVAFYERYADFTVFHRRERTGLNNGPGTPVAWLGDGQRRFALVLAQVKEVQPALCGFAHLGVACASRAIVDERCVWARRAGCLVLEPSDRGPQAGYTGFVADPDGHQLELSYGQKVAYAMCDEAAVNGEAWEPALRSE